MQHHDFVVTGGAGFVGSHLVDRLARHGRVLVLDDLSTGSAAKLATARLRGHVDLELGDVCDAAWLRSVLASAAPRAPLFHLAVRNLRRSLREPMEAHRVNATGTLTMLEAWRARPERGRFVYVSTSEVLGSSSEPLDETSAPAPTTAYGASKLAAEAYVEQARRAGWLEATIVRPFNAFGPRSHVEGDAGELIPRFLVLASRGEALPVYGDGRQTRTFTFVEDTAEAIERAGERPEATRGVVLVAASEHHSVLAIAERVATVVGRAVHLEHLAPRAGDLRGQRAETARSRVALDWEPRVTFDDGLARTWEALRASAPSLAVPREPWGVCA